MDYTLRIDGALLKKAEAYAQWRGVSLDSLVESHLIHLLLKDMGKDISPFVEEMRSNSVKDGILNYKAQMKGDYES